MAERREFDQRSVVTAFLRHGGKILLVRRSRSVGTYRGRWSGISGYLEAAPLEQALTEIREETALAEDQVQLVAGGEPLQVADEDLGVRWTIYPFLFDVREPDAITLDWENLELRWVAPADFARYPTVPALEAAYRRCAERDDGQNAANCAADG